MYNGMRYMPAMVGLTIVKETPAMRVQLMPRAGVASSHAVGSSCGSLSGLDASGCAEPRCAFTFSLHEACEIWLRHRHQLSSVLCNPVAHFWLGKHASDVLRKLVDHIDRSASWDPY